MTVHSQDLLDYLDRCLIISRATDCGNDRGGIAGQLSSMPIEGRATAGG
jgi:hypothetical protein